MFSPFFTLRKLLFIGLVIVYIVMAGEGILRHGTTPFKPQREIWRT
jgi:hypothetical protein